MMKGSVFYILLVLAFSAPSTPGVAQGIPAPSVEIQGEPAIVNSTAAFPVSAVFSEVVSGFIDTDVSLGNATVTAFSSTDDITFNIEITPSGAGDISIDIAAGVAGNAGLIGNTAAMQALVVYDAIAPVVDIQNEPETVNTLVGFDIEVHFSEPVTGFVDTDIAIVNAAVSAFVQLDDDSYRIQITPDGVGDISIDIAAGVARDAAQNSSLAADQARVVFDATPPGVNIHNEPVTVSTLDAFDITVEFTEPVSGFVDTDITVVNAAVSDFIQLDEQSYSVQITPNGGGHISIDIAAGVAQDAALNGNLAATRALVDFDTIAPIADAGPDQVVKEGDTAIMLDGSDSSDEPPGMVVGYAWTQVSGPVVTLSDANTALPEFTAPFVISDEVLRFNLVVSDDFDGPSIADQVAITVTNVLAVDAGVDQQVSEAEVVQLNGLNSLAIDGSITDYRWTQIEGPIVRLNNDRSAATTFTAPPVDATTLLVFELIVSDASGARDRATAFVNVRDELFSGTAPPLEVELVDNRVSSEALYLFDLTTDSFGLNAVEWHQVNGPEVILNDAMTVLPSFTAPRVTMDSSAGFEVRATDSDGLVVRAGVNVNIREPLSMNMAPDADAGVDQTVNESDTLFLDARNSTDADGSIVRFYWHQTAGPPVLLSSITSARPSFVAPPIAPADSGSTLRFEVVVIDDAGFVDRDSVTIVIVDNGIDGPDNVATVVSTTSEVIGIQTSNGSNLVTLETSDPSSILDNDNRPAFLAFGLIDFGVRVVPGSRVRISFLLPSPAPPDLTWWKYSNAGGWMEYGASFNSTRDVVTISIRDNGRGDDDPMPGIIRDPGGLGPASAMKVTGNGNNTTTSSDGSSGGGSTGPYLLFLLLLLAVAITTVKRVASKTK